MHLLCLVRINLWQCGKSTVTNGSLPCVFSHVYYVWLVLLKVCASKLIFSILYTVGPTQWFFYRAMHMHKRGICRHPVSVCLSVTFVSCAKTNKDIFEIFSLSGSQAILVFPHQTGWRYSDGNTPNGGVECKGGMKKLTIFDRYLAVSQKRL